MRPGPPPERPRRWLTLTLACAALSAAATARAEGIPFATFNQTTTGDAFEFSGPGRAGLFRTDLSARVTFNFLPATGLETRDRAATVTLDASTHARARPVVSPNGPAIVSQPLNGPNNVLSVTEDATGKNLLTLTFTGALFGQQGGLSASLRGSTDAGDVVTYSSDYLTFTDGPGSFLLGLPTVTPGLTTGPDGFLRGFVTDATGSFSGTFAAVPEPASLVTFGGGMAVAAALAVRRFRK